MHIPDGYLSPQTCGVFGAAMVPVWATAAHRVKRVVRNRHVPLLAIGAAYCFLVMMFNIPVPDGTTAHATGAVLVAVLLGPWAAVVAVSIALAIQALFFGDGGVLAFTANAFNMAFAMPVVGYAVYRVLARRSTLTARRRALAAGVAGYVGINVAALLTAIEFGLQPVLFKAADGTPLYAPFHLAQAVPAMLFAHLLVAGVVEAALTAGVVGYLQRANVPLLRVNHPDVEVGVAGVEPDAGVRWRPVVIGLSVMALLTPLGLVATGTAFGEDVPADRAIWRHALFDGYGLGGHNAVLGYLVSAVVGVAFVAGLVGALALVRSRRTMGREKPPIASRTGVGGVARTPDWLLRPEIGLCSCREGGSRRRGGFVEKTIGGAAGVLRQALFSEDTAAAGGLLQRIDARVKVLTLAGLLLAVALTRHIPVLLVAYAATVALAAASRLPVRFFVKRVWLFIPLFTGIVVLPATLSVITPGDVVVPLGSWFGHDVGITAQGLRSAGLIVARVATSISLVLLLTLTTPWNRLLAALRSLAVPRVFVLVMAMAYRYVFHLLHAVTDMYTARKSRMPSSDRDVRAGRAFVSATAGALFGRANALADEVHLAMVSRGFTGEVRTLDRFRVRALDWAWAAAALVAALAVIGGDRVLGR